MPDITAAGASLVAITPEIPDQSLSTVEKHELTFEVLSDGGNEVARQFGLVFQLPADLRAVYAGLESICRQPRATTTSNCRFPAPLSWINTARSSRLLSIRTILSG